jgi:hypothetical protein
MTTERATSGIPCEGAADSCASALAMAKMNQGPYEQSCGMVGPCRHFVVTTQGDTVKRYTNRAELLTFLGPISTAQEVLLLLDYDGYRIMCDGKSGLTLPPGAPGASVVAKGNGFEATVLLELNNCPFTYAVVVASVSASGEVKELSRKTLDWMGPCAGRRPEGWIAGGPAETKSRLADHFAMMAELEAASVTAFEVLAAELEYHGAPSELIARLREAAREEVRHAHDTGELARAFGASPSPARVEPRPIRSLEAIAIDNAVEGCVRETFGAAMGCYQAEAAADPNIAALMRTLATDETSHAALAFELHGWIMPQLTAAGRARVLEARAHAVEALSLELQVEPDSTLRELAGMPGACEAMRLHETLSHDLWNDGALA